MNLTEISMLDCVLQGLLNEEEVGIFLLLGFTLANASSWSIMQWYPQNYVWFFFLPFKCIPPNFFHLPLLFNVTSLNTSASRIPVILGINVCSVRVQSHYSPIPAHSQLRAATPHLRPVVMQWNLQFQRWCTLFFQLFSFIVSLRVTGVFHRLYLLDCKVLKGESQNLVICYTLLHTVEGKGNKDETWNVERRKHLFFSYLLPIARSPTLESCLQFWKCSTATLDNCIYKHLEVQMLSFRVGDAILLVHSIHLRPFTVFSQSISTFIIF